MPKPIYSKVKAMTLAGATVAILAFVLREMTGVDLPAEIVSAAVVIVSFIFGYFKLERVG